MSLIASVPVRVLMAVTAIAMLVWLLWPCNPHLSVASDKSPPPELKTAPDMLDSSPGLAAPPAHTPATVWGVIGEDERKPVPYPHAFPGRAVVRIETDAVRSPCTGWLIGDDTVVTAGHCVHNGYGGDSGWATTGKVRVASTVKGASIENAYYEPCSATRLYTTTEWMKGGDEKGEAFDYGAIKLDCDLGKQVGTFGAAITPTPWPAGRVPHGYGYDSKATDQECKVPGRVIQLCHGPGTLSRANGGMLYYDIDTKAGTSGGVILISGAACAHCAVAIHTRDTHIPGQHAPAGSHTQLNHGVLITEPVFRNLQAWRDAR
jgi:glutamyl endopeptidase